MGKVGQVRYFDLGDIYFKLIGITVVTATITNRLHNMNHVFGCHRETTFHSINHKIIKSN
jgi:hypothetical protein